LGPLEELGAVGGGELAGGAVPGGLRMYIFRAEGLHYYFAVKRGRSGGLLAEG